MSRLNKTQRLAKMIGVECGVNSWFLDEGTRMADIKNPDNRNVKIGENVSIALGSLTSKYLPLVAREAMRPHFPNAFAPPLDKPRRKRTS